MALAIRIQKTGGPKLMELAPLDQVAPGPGQAWVEQVAIGVNFLDVTHRNGAVPITLPSGLGIEAAGRVTAIGEGVQTVAVGDRVAYALGPLGSYASGRLYPAERLLRIPDRLSFDDAAALMVKGITAQYLLHSTYAVAPGTTVLMYGVAGGLGQVMAPWAKRLGAYLIGVVSKEASVERAKRLGCDDVLVWGSCDVPAEAKRLTEGRGVDVVYDGVGRLSFEASVASLRVRGTMVSIGATSGVPAPVDLRTINQSSLFLTRPSLVHHTTAIAEYARRAQDVFEAVERGWIQPQIWKEFPLADAAVAHELLEQGKAAGTILLKPA